jgi:hypothetical protein
VHRALPAVTRADCRAHVGSHRYQHHTDDARLLDGVGEAQAPLPAEFLPAFCIAVGSDEPITFLARRAGLFTMQDRDVLRADLARQMEIRETAAKKMRQIKSFLEQID